MTTREPGAEVARVLASPELAAHIRDARSVEDPCDHWIGQSLAVCAPCLRDRIAPHLAAALMPVIAAERAEAAAGALREAAEDWRSEGRSVMFNRAGDDLTPHNRVGKWLRGRADRVSPARGEGEES